MREILFAFSLIMFAFHSLAYAEKIDDAVEGANGAFEERRKNIDPNGMIVQTRFVPPEGFKRKKYDDYSEYMRSLPLLPDGSPVYLFDGSLKRRQDVHVAVLDIDVGKRDLQQCADAALRLRCEYYYSRGENDKIMFHLSNWQELSWNQWKSGYRLKKFEGSNKTQMNKIAKADDSYKNFRRYTDTLFMYAGVNSVMKESQKIDLGDMRPGDVFASVGHLIIVFDVAENEAGEKAFILGQSYMPAQQIHILKNPVSDSPWYFVKDLTFPFRTPEWHFPAPGPNLYRMP